MNLIAVGAIYRFEMARTFRTLLQSVVSPVLSTSLYFIVFGTAIGSRIQEVEGVTYGAFIVPCLIMLTVLTQSVSNASFGIYFPKFIGTIFEHLSAPSSFLEITAGYVLAAATKSLMIGLIILATAFFFVDLRIEHPLWMLTFLILTWLRSQRRKRKSPQSHSRSIACRLIGVLIYLGNTNSNHTTPK